MIFDPAWDDRPCGVRWQVFRRMGKRGLTRVEATNGDRVHSKALGVWLRAVGDGRSTRIRIAIGPRGDEIVPTAEEGEEAERAAKDAERAAKEGALARVAELEAKLARATNRRRRG